jgi:hypothetical protein
MYGAARFVFIAWCLIKHRENFTSQNQIEDYRFLVRDAM